MDCLRVINDVMQPVYFVPRNRFCLLISISVCLACVTSLRQAKMAASCCGVKRQKLNNSMPAVCCNGSSAHSNYHKNGYTVAVADMCFFCFDVLHSHLYSYEQPKSPIFTNESL